MFFNWACRYCLETRQIFLLFSPLIFSCEIATIDRSQTERKRLHLIKKVSQVWQSESASIHSWKTHTVIISVGQQNRPNFCWRKKWDFFFFQISNAMWFFYKKTLMVFSVSILILLFCLCQFSPFGIGKVDFCAESTL